MKILHKGDPCPCCGNPIQTDDPERLLVLSWLAQYPAIKDIFPNKGKPPYWADHLMQRFTKME